MPPITSCTTQDPFIKLDPAGQAAILDYSLPAETEFEVKGYMDIKVPDTCWSAFASAVPDTNFWEATKDLSATQVLELINEDILGSSATPMFLNNRALQRLSLVDRGNGLKAAPRAGEGKGPRTASNSQVQQVAMDDDKTLIAGLSGNQVVSQILKGRRPLVRPNFYGKPVVTFIPKPKAVKPTLTLVFHYKVLTFAGDYGAGRTLKTFSLLPGEKTTISITTFKNDEERKSRAESILDSFTESSAQEFQNTVENQSGREMTSESAETKSKELSGGVNLTSIGVPVDVSGGVSNGSTSSNTMSEHISAITSAMNTHTSNASSNRDVSVNTESSSTSINEVTESTVRQLQNINLSRVLNFVFRQLLQEYITITYLDDVSIVFSNGYPESRRVAKLSNINDLLNEVLKDEPGTPCANIIEKTRKGIFRQLCNILDHTDSHVPFMECITETLTACCDDEDEPVENTYARKILGLSQTAEGKTVPGIILGVKKRIMRTESVVCDALLGQGEALDCFNQQLQNIAVNKAQLENDVITQQLGVIEHLDTTAEKADKYKKVFGSCCEVPQSGCGGGCSCNCSDPKDDGTAHL